MSCHQLQQLCTMLLRYPLAVSQEWGKQGVSEWVNSVGLGGFQSVESSSCLSNSCSPSSHAAGYVIWANADHQYMWSDQYGQHVDVQKYEGYQYKNIKRVPAHWIISPIWLCVHKGWMWLMDSGEVSVIHQTHPVRWMIYPDSVKQSEANWWGEDWVKLSGHCLELRDLKSSSVNLESHGEKNTVLDFLSKERGDIL